MEKLLSYPLTAIYFVFFGITLLVFHPVQWFCLNVFGYRAHKASVSILNLCLMGCTFLLGTRYSFRNPHKLPKDKPLILVANHQSMNDIPPIIWYLRAHHPKFVSKRELGKGIPSVSFNLRHGGSVLINRKDKEQSLEQIRILGKYIAQHNRAAVIFPEGTRSRTGVPKKFFTGGLKALMSSAPSALIVPISINNSWKMLKFGKFPYGLGNHIKFQVHKPRPITEDYDTLLAEVESQIVAHIKPPE